MAAKAQKPNKQKIVTPKFRVSYPHVFKAQSMEDGGKKKFSVTMLFDKDEDLTLIKEAIKNAKIAEFGPNKADWPKNLESPVNDGDDEKYEDKEGYAGHYIIKASTNEDQRPGVFDEDLSPITDASNFYPGCYARAQVYAYVWTFGKKQGVGFILDNVQKLEDGESFSSRMSAEEAFGGGGTKKKKVVDEDGF